MNEVERRRAIADESALERAYEADLIAKAKRSRREHRRVVNNTWTQPDDDDVSVSAEFVGRIALSDAAASHVEVANFYIGFDYYAGDDYVVYPWTAPLAACSFYGKPADRESLGVVADGVLGTRRFARNSSGIVDLDDEVAPGVADPFPARALEVPRAPTSGATPQRPVARAQTSFPEEEQPDLTPKAVAPRAEPPVPGPPLKAPGLLRRQLAAPKTSAMSAVLATLQPDQYAAITKPVDESQILQGHPGTGKTIVAAHRAGFLLDPSSEQPLPNGRVLIIGPTAEYEGHVRGVLAKLIGDPTRYQVTSLPSLLEKLANLPDSTVPTQTTGVVDASRELAALVDQAFVKAKADAAPGQRPTRSAVYSALVGLLKDPSPNGLGAEWVTYLRGLPATYPELERQRRSSHRGLMAYIGVRAGHDLPQPGHVIVDEAQDVNPIEWEVLGRLGNRGGWTIVGDLNQRRTDHTFSSWDGVAEVLAIENEDGRAPVEILQRGYRSSSQIIRFAGQLLPRQSRDLFSIQQEGELPTVSRVLSKGDLMARAFDSATELLGRVGEGTVAVITPNTVPFTKLLLGRRWRMEPGDTSLWRGDDRLLRVLPPERARGLEFDAVVVIEPAEFPENFGRQGVLYTALTRANRFLSIVHHRALPGGMKARP